MEEQPILKLEYELILSDDFLSLTRNALTISPPPLTITLPLSSLLSLHDLFAPISAYSTPSFQRFETQHLPQALSWYQLTTSVSNLPSLKLVLPQLSVVVLPNGESSSPSLSILTQAI